MVSRFRLIFFLKEGKSYITKPSSNKIEVLLEGLIYMKSREGDINSIYLEEYELIDKRNNNEMGWID